MKHPIIALVIALCAGVAFPAYADKVVPIAEVESRVIIRKEPASDSAELGELKPGESLNYHAAIPRWYAVDLPNGQIGYVSKRWTDLIEAPDETAEGAVDGAPSYLLDIVDVGTGLAAIVRAEGFFLVYDGGSNDDGAQGANNRLLAYLKETYPDLAHINHIVLSHPHQDHVALLPDLFDEYSVGEVWDSGRTHDICAYRQFLQKASQEEGAVYHNALVNDGVHSAQFAPDKCATLPSEIDIEAGARIGANVMSVRDDIDMQFLYVDGDFHQSPNENSLVLSLRLGGTRILFMGDAEAGGRFPPAKEPDIHSIEGMLVECCAEELKSDILIAGHHGSMTSSRRKFLDLVRADQYVISSGPKKYSTVVLPDVAVVEELASRGALWRTDIDDGECGQADGKTGNDRDNKPGGCSNIRFEIGNTEILNVFVLGADQS